MKCINARTMLRHGPVRVFISGPTYGEAQMIYFHVGLHIMLWQWRHK